MSLSGDGLIVMVTHFDWLSKTTTISHFIAELRDSLKYQIVYAPFGTTTNRSLLSRQDLFSAYTGLSVKITIPAISFTLLSSNLGMIFLCIIAWTDLGEEVLRITCVY